MTAVLRFVNPLKDAPGEPSAPAPAASEVGEPTTPVRPLRYTVRPTSRGKIVGGTPTMIDVLATIDRVAHSSCAVLVTGESGTGKELVVAALHDASPRKQAPLVTVSCGAMPEDLLESELFGHGRGAITGAQQGRIAAAQGGTLFLDEIGELPLSLQVKLLRVLQQREYSPVGDNRTVQCDVRVVASTNRDLEKEVAAGRFREDLYYRLNVIHVHLPALRERRDDIPALAMHFLRGARERSGRADLEGFTADALEALKEQDWQGNVRALENTVERAVLLSAGPRIEARELGLKTRTSAKAEDTRLPEGGIDLRAAIERYENDLIRQALTRTNGNRNRAAQLLGLNRTTLVEMLKRKRLATGTDGA